MEPFSVQNFFYSFGANALGVSYIWLPLISGYFLIKLWVYYVRFYFINNLEWVLLEIKLPREIPKGPVAMEMILNALYQTRDGRFHKKYWDGLLRAWFSLEIASINGQIHFYIYTQKSLRSLVEHQIYAQYPNVEIAEAEDYAKKIYARSGGNFKFYAVEAELEKEDAYPIKTYIDYGLHNLQTEEEQKNDPLTSLLEFMGSLKEGEQVWFQVMIRATKHGKKWKESAQKIVDKIMKRDEEPKEGEIINFSSLGISPGEKLVVEAIERNVAKVGFDVCIRMAYLAEEEKYSPIIRGVLGGIIKQFSSNNLNGFGLTNATLYADFFFPGIRHSQREKRMFDAYIKRSSFYLPHTRKLFILNTEGLATIYHFPGRVAETPMLARIEAKKGGPPINLPV